MESLHLITQLASTRLPGRTKARPYDPHLPGRTKARPYNPHLPGRSEARPYQAMVFVGALVGGHRHRVGDTMMMQSVGDASVVGNAGAAVSTKRLR